MHWTAMVASAASPCVTSAEQGEEGIFASSIRNKNQMARFIAMQFSKLALYVQPERKPWMSKDPRMAIFNAAAFAMVLFDGGRGCDRPELQWAGVYQSQFFFFFASRARLELDPGRCAPPPPPARIAHQVKM